MTTTGHALPANWRIHIKPAANILTLALADEHGTECQLGFHMKQVPAPDTVHALEEITDPELRATAQELIDTYLARLATVHKNADAFNAAFPDWSDLITRLRATIPGCRIETDLDSDALALRLTLTATGAAAGQLLALLATWRTDTTSSGGGDELDDGTLTAVLDQEEATGFLTWFRTRS